MWTFILIVGGLIALALVIEFLPIGSRRDIEQEKVDQGNAEDHLNEMKIMVQAEINKNRRV